VGKLNFEEITELDRENMELESLGSMLHPAFWKNLTKELTQK
jgi:hypothetical protein